MYPFGLVMSAISKNAAGSLENKYKFNGKEQQHQEFSDNSGLEWYATNFRSLDPQLGKFWQIDPLAQTLPGFSPYQFANDNPTLLNDPTGIVTDSTDKKGNVWYDLADVVLVPASKKGSSNSENIFLFYSHKFKRYVTALPHHF